MPGLVRTAGPAGFPAPGEWAPRCNLTGGLLRRVVLTKASGKLHNRIGIAARARRGAFGDGRARQSCVLNKEHQPVQTPSAASRADHASRSSSADGTTRPPTGCPRAPLYKTGSTPLDAAPDRRPLIGVDRRPRGWRSIRGSNSTCVGVAKYSAPGRRIRRDQIWRITSKTRRIRYHAVPQRDSSIRCPPIIDGLYCAFTQPFSGHCASMQIRRR
jgi:hypothetical protein